METKLVVVASIIICCYLCLHAASAHQKKPPLKEVEMSPRKVLLQAAATGPDLPAAETPRPRSLGDSLASRLVLIAVPFLCAIVAGILCRLRGRQNGEVAAAETVRPNITYNFIGSCFSLN